VPTSAIFLSTGDGTGLFNYAHAEPGAWYDRGRGHR
jgi:hypothetical protein